MRHQNPDGLAATTGISPLTPVLVIKRGLFLPCIADGLIDRSYPNAIKTARPFRKRSPNLRLSTPRRRARWMTRHTFFTSKGERPPWLSTSVFSYHW